MLRWVLAAVLSGTVVVSATHNEIAQALLSNSLPAARSWKGCATGAPADPVSRAVASRAEHGRSGATAGAPRSATTLILTDMSPHSDERIYTTLATNLVSHFGPVKVKKVSAYVAGMLTEYRAAIYVGTAQGKLLPPAFLGDVRTGVRPVLWLGYNIDQLAPPALFGARYGWRYGPFEQMRVRAIRYKGTSLSRDPSDTDPLATFSAVDPRRATVLGQVVTASGQALPWAVRSGNLTYVGEVALDAAADNDRYLAVADMLFDVLAPATRPRHRALVRLEDIGPEEEPAAVRAAGELLSREHVPFSFGVYPVYRGPLSEGRKRKEIRLKDRPELVRAITYLLGHGGTMVLHGYSHQADHLANPTNGESGEDFEFFRTHWDRSHRLVYDGPLPGDSAAWARDRFKAAIEELRAAHLPVPRIVEFPHYAASRTDYRVAARMFAARYDRGQFFSPAWNGRSPASPHMYEQYVPYVVRDTYGSVVLPETLGFVEQGKAPERESAVRGIVANARTQMVVRDNVASFFFHPFLGTKYLSEAIDQFQRMGYRFVSPCDL